MSAMKFRRQCAECNITFFTVEKNAKYCFKCNKKIVAVKIEKPVMSEIMAKGKISGGISPVTEKIKAETTARKLQPTKKIRAPKLKELGEYNYAYVKERVSIEYQQLKASTLPLRKKHQQIANRLWIERKIVAQIVEEIRMEEASVNGTVNISAEDKSRVIDIYLKMVRQGYRPAEGRRTFIANELGLKQKTVKLIVQEWFDNNIKPLSRDQLFCIEKEYWALLDKNTCPISELYSVIAAKVGFANNDQVARWIDFLNDGSKVNSVMLPVDCNREQVIAAYHDYLSENSPPEQALHYSLGEKFNLSVKQIHQILHEYRLQSRDYLLKQS